MNRTKDEVQAEAVRIFDLHKGSGILQMATGTGKSKIPIEIAKRDYYPGYRILICVPTEKLRDKNWKEEFIKWGAESIWNDCVERTCYVSMPKLIDQHYDLVVLDECHNITENNSSFFSQCTCKKLIGLTATMPKDSIKLSIFNSLHLKVIYSVSMDQAVEWGLVSPYKIIVVRTDIDKVTKNIAAGNKKKPFMQSEYAAYQYITKKIYDMQYDEDVNGNPIKMDLNSNERARLKMLLLQRMRLIYNFKSKLDTAKYLLRRLIPESERTLIFAGSIAHADELCIHSFHSKSGKKSTTFEDFCEKKINRMSCVDSVNEGHNIPDLDRALIVQLNSKSLKMIQRIGRVVRFREDHIARIIIVVAKGTMDEQWTKTALAEFDEDNITVYNLTDLKAKYG